MNSDLKSFFKEEQKRAFEPGPYFTQRVMARLASGKAVLVQNIWDFLPGAMRPVLGMALTVLFAALAVQILDPVKPLSSAVEASFNQHLTSREQLLYAGSNVNISAAQLDDLILWEPMP